MVLYVTPTKAQMLFTTLLVMCVKNDWSTVANDLTTIKVLFCFGISCGAVSIKNYLIKNSAIIASNVT